MFSGYILQIYFFGSYSAKRETDIYRMQKLLLSGSCYSAKRETRNLDGWYLNSLIVEGLVEFFLLYSTHVY